jgi:YHS domain-containing protein
MFRAFLELVITILLALVARAVISSVMKSFGGAASQAFRQSSSGAGAAQNANSNPSATPAGDGPERGRELHKDPVCGTYVTDSTVFKRTVSGKGYFYCSEQCQNRHSLIVR